MKFNVMKVIDSKGDVVWGLRYKGEFVECTNLLDFIDEVHTKETGQNFALEPDDIIEVEVG